MWGKNHIHLCCSQIKTSHDCQEAFFLNPHYWSPQIPSFFTSSAFYRRLLSLKSFSPDAWTFLKKQTIKFELKFHRGRNTDWLPVWGKDTTGAHISEIKPLIYKKPCWWRLFPQTGPSALWWRTVNTSAHRSGPYRHVTLFSTSSPTAAENLIIWVKWDFFFRAQAWKSMAQAHSETLILNCNFYFIPMNHKLKCSKENV